MIRVEHSPLQGKIIAELKPPVKSHEKPGKAASALHLNLSCRISLF
jgi:hypothetical protein